jgi:mitochondrial fission protein ELM1
MESQAIGLAEAIGGHVTPLRVAARAPWRWLPGGLWPMPLAAAAGPDMLAPPWPDLVVTCGRHAAPMGAAIRRATQGATRAVHVQNPRMSFTAFDLVVAPEHDGVSGQNVLTHRLALHRITPAGLAAARAAWAPRFSGLRRPLVAVLVGAPGDGDAGHAARLAQDLARLARPGGGAGIADSAERARAGGAGHAAEPGAGLVVTPSRRTPPEAMAALRAALPGAWVWDGAGENPYRGMLASADAIVATEDSVSMVSEALAAGVPVFAARFGSRSGRLAGFLERLVADGIIRWFDGTLPLWETAPRDDTPRLAAEIRRRLGWD